MEQYISECLQAKIKKIKKLLESFYLSSSLPLFKGHNVVFLVNLSLGNNCSFCFRFSEMQYVALLNNSSITHNFEMVDAIKLRFEKIKIDKSKIHALESVSLCKVWTLYEIKLDAYKMAIGTPIYSRLQQLFSGMQPLAEAI